jgi:hypothetical protein
VRTPAALRHGLHAASVLRLAASHAGGPIGRHRPCAAAESIVLSRSVRAGGAMRALGAVVVGAKVDSLAAEGAAVVDELLVLLDGHVDWCVGG